MAKQVKRGIVKEWVTEWECFTCGARFASQDDAIACEAVHKRDWTEERIQDIGLEINQLASEIRDLEDERNQLLSPSGTPSSSQPRARPDK